MNRLAGGGSSAECTIHISHLGSSSMFGFQL